MDYLTTYWDTCFNYECEYAEKQNNYMPSLIFKSILTKNCSTRFEHHSYYCTLCASKIFTLTLLFWYMGPRQKWENNINMGPKEICYKGINGTDMAQQGSNGSFCTHNNEC